MKFQKTVVFCLFFLCCERTNAQYDFKKVDAWLTGHNGEMGGRTILMVFKNDHIIYTHTVNDMTMKQKFIARAIARRQGKTADLDDYTPSTRQPIASCSKWLSAALVMTFIDEGKLKLTDTVGKYLPILTQHGKGNITIGECLSHLTAINEPGVKESWGEMKDFKNMDDAVNYIAGMPMEGVPGKTFHYSNAGLQIAGDILEKISGKSFETLFSERIATPLNMKNTDFGKGKVPIPAGSATSTPQDYLNFLVMILNNGVFNGKRILSEHSIAEMQMNRITSDVNIAYKPAEAGDFSYGYGEWTMGNNIVSSPGLFGSFPWVDNNNKYAAFMMTYYLKNTGRHERYVELMNLVAMAINTH